MVGTTLNHYRILRLLGSGGMGEVYEAEDTRLHRKVALKLLPRALASDPDPSAGSASSRADAKDERRQRFEREAQAVAALNHPNIVTIYSVEETPSAAPGQAGVPFLTMELVEGSTLGDLIPKGGLPLDRLLKIGIAAADAISAAQQKGITHRDLKPGNIMVTPAGQVKVLDFGLAKLRDMEADAGAQVATTLATGGLTGEGRILGTVAYMSPEQAQGKPVDTRSDIFSLGVILHQMATGEQPFAGDTPVSVISSILKDTPSSVTEVKPGLPSDLSRIVRRCLAKDPERRFQTALDLRNELEELRAGQQSGGIGASGVQRAPAYARRRPLFAGVAAVALVGVIAVAWYAIRGRRPVTPEAPAVSLEDMRISRLTSTGSASLAAISPDGKYVVHVVRDRGQQSLWMRQTATTSNVRIVPPADVRYDGLTISPDATYVYYSAYEGAQAFSALYQVPALGGTPRKILEDIDSPVSFSPDGSEFVFVRGILDPPGAQLLVARADGADERVLATSPASEIFSLERPSWSPDGARVAVAYTSLQAGGTQGVTTVAVASGEVQPLAEPRWGDVGDVAWLADGAALVASVLERGAVNRQIWRIEYPDGTATRVTNDLASYSGISLSADSRALVTVQTDTIANLWVMPAGETPTARQITSGSARYDGIPGLAWTPDGRIVYASPASGNAEIWIANGDGSGQAQLTVDPAADVHPRVCGNGRFIVFTSLRTGVPQVWRMALDGSDPVQLSNGPVGFLPVCAPAGDEVVYTSETREGRYTIWRVPLEGGEPVMAREVQSQSAAMSPDGRTIAGPYTEAQRQSIGVFSIDSSEAPRVLPIFPRPVAWSPDGLALTYVDVRDGVANIWRQPLPSGTPAQLTEFTSDTIYGFAWSTDGKQLALSRGTTSTDVVLLTAPR